MGGSRAFLTALFTVLLLAGLASPASCTEQTRRVNIVGVDGSGAGQVYQLEIQTYPGSGTIYTAIRPTMGIAAQESEALAVERAFESTGLDPEGCNVLFKINDNSDTSSVDGPSAGGAMTIALRAALLGKRVRQDVVITGTASQDNTLGGVGGIVEKALAAQEAGARYFLVPQLELHEALLLASAAGQSDFHVIEVPTIEDAEKVAFSNYSETFESEFSPESAPLPASLRPIQADSDLGRFALVAKKVIDGLDTKVKNARARQGASEGLAEIFGYFQKEIQKQYSLLSLGYPFTAANSAFLLSIDAEYAEIGGNEIDLAGSFDGVRECTDSLSKTGKTLENAHWAIGADLRRTWAKTKLNNSEQAAAEQGDYNTLRDLLFANSWCAISRELAAQAGETGGTPVDESVLAGLASEKLADASERLSSGDTVDYDALWHLVAAFEANESGEFGAAIYDAVYASTMQEIASGSQTNVTYAAEELMKGDRTSLWGKIYYGQGAYLYAESREEKAAPLAAYKILKYSQELDKVSAEIDRELSSGRGRMAGMVQLELVDRWRAYSQGDAAIAVGFSACIILFAAIGIYRVLKRGAHRQPGKEI